jgi:hypothetical protein
MNLKLAAISLFVRADEHFSLRFPPYLLGRSRKALVAPPATAATNGIRSTSMNMKFLLISAVLLLTTGCGLGSLLSTSAPSPVTVPASTKVSGIVMGGQQPVGGILLQLYTVGTTGYGSVSTPLGASFQTTAYGNFNLPAYTCPGDAMTYLVGTGGQPIAAVGSTPAVTNPNLALMVGLGKCSTIAANFIDMNEVTTVATVWALSPFMTDATHIGATTTNSVGIVNAFANINKLTNTATGAVSGPALPSGAVLPTMEINTLADILEQCVNSGGSDGQPSDGVTTGNGCDKLFYLTGGSSNTVSAALYIAQHPSTNVASLNKLRSASPVFQQPFDVNSPPLSWSIVITHSGGGLSNPQSIATDQQGNVWVANAGNSSVSEFNPLGGAISTATGFTQNISVPYALAIDQSGNAWVANSGSNTITELTPLGVSSTSHGDSTQLNAPKGIAIDGSNNVWVTNSGNSSVSAFNSSGQPLSGSPYTGSGITTPVAIAINPK